MSWIQRLAIVLVMVSSPVLAQNIDNHLQQFCQRLAIGEQIEVFDQPIHTSSIVSRFFQMREYQPVWHTSDQVDDVLAVIKSADQEGLFKEDYHYRQLMTLYEGLHDQHEDTDYHKAQFELLMTDAVLLYAFHMVNGKVDPANLEESWNYARRQLLDDEVIGKLNQYAEAGTVAKGLVGLTPYNELYAGLKKGLVLYSQLAAENDFMVIADTPTLRPGDQSDAVAALRQRLIDLKFMEPATAAPALFDQNLHDAVMVFQQQHGLDADGVVGGQSWRALNVSFADRADQIRVNLERNRWVQENLSDNFVLVNIAGFKLYLVRDRKLVWTTNVMTGKVKTETPVFASRIAYLEFNPTWTVPRSIMKKSLIAKFKADPGYLARKQFHLVDRDGVVVDPATLDWDSLNPHNFPYTAVQQPSDINALGQVKFIFPNAYSIYLHDTPSKQLFSRTARAFSHGCIRVQEPFEFARLLLDDQGYSAEKITRIVEGKKRTRISLTQTVDVLLMYWTAEPGDTGRVKFNPDIYQRDADVLEALKEPLD